MTMRVPTTLDELLSDEETRRKAQEWIATGGVTAGAEERAPYAWQADNVVDPPSVDLEHQSKPITFGDRARAFLEATSRIPGDELTRYGVAADAAARRILGESPPLVTPREPSRAAVKQAAPAKAGKSTDPGSPESRRAQGLVKEILGDNISDEALATMSEADADNILKYGTAKAQRGIQQASEAGKAERFTAQQIQQGKQYAEMMGYRWDELDLKKQLGWARIAQDSAELEDRRTGRAEAKATKEQDEAKKTAVPGLLVAPGASPTPQDAETVKKALDAEGALNAGIARMRELHKQYGTEKGGRGDMLMKQALTGIRLEAKTIAELGALSGPDQDLMVALGGDDPTTAWANVKGFFGTDNTEDALQGLEAWMSGKVAAKLKARGYVRAGEGASQGPVKRVNPAQALPKDASGQPTLEDGGGMVTMVNPKGKRFKVPASEVAAAEKKRWKRVQ